MIPGIVRVSVTGEQCQRFMNLCRGRGIILKKIVCAEKNELRMNMRVADFFQIAPLRRKTGVHIHILKKRGPLFFWLALKRRKRVPAGLLTMLLVLFFLSGRVWNIHIEGNVQNTTSQLMDFLEEKNIYFGIPKKKIHCSELAEGMREKFPEITWVSARLSGSSLYFDIREGNRKTEKEEKAASSLFSTVDGTVESMVTRQGTPLIHVGDEVKKGQEMISGVVTITDDSQEAIRYAYVASDADVYVRHAVSYYDMFPLTVKKKVFCGKEKKYFFLRFGEWMLDLSPPAGKKEERLISERVFEPGENFRMSVFTGLTTVKKYEIRSEKLTENEAKKQAVQRLHLYEEKLIEKGVQISENNVKIEINHQDCVSRGTLTVIEKTGREAPTEKKTQPKERTPEDG